MSWVNATFPLGWTRSLPLAQQFHSYIAHQPLHPASELRSSSMPLSGGQGSGSLALVLASVAGSLLGKLVYQMEVGG